MAVKFVLIFQIEVFLKEKDSIFDKLYDIADDFHNRDGGHVMELQKEEVYRNSLPIHFRSSSGPLGSHRWFYELSHNTI